MDPQISEVPPEVLERATLKLRQLFGLEFGQALSHDPMRQKLY
jgi:hypothetical protein